MLSLNRAARSAYRSGVSDLDKATERVHEPHLVEVNYTVLVAALCDLGIPEEALPLAEIIVRENPEDAYALNGLGRTFRLLGRLGDAEGCFMKALAIGGRAAADAVAGLLALIKAYRTLGEHQKAARLEKVLANEAL